MRIVPTWLGAHEIPLEYRESRGGAARVRRPARARDDSRGRAREARALRRRVLRARRLHRRRDAARSSTAARDAGLAAQAARRRADVRAAAPSWPRRSARRRPITSRRSRDAGIAALARAATVATLLPGHHAVPRQARSRRRRARLIEAGVAGRAGDRLQPRHVADAELPARPHPGRQPAPAERRRGAGRRDGQRGRGARPRRPSRADRAGLFGRSGAVRRRATFASCRTGTATAAASAIVDARQTLSPQ